MVAGKRYARYFGLSLWGALSKDPYMQRMSSALATTLRSGFVLAIALGRGATFVCTGHFMTRFGTRPNVISAWWVLIFLVLLIIGYLALYRVYGLNHTYATDGTPLPHQGEMRGVFWLAGAFVIMIACGVIMHAVSNQALFPQEWMQWYAPEGKVDPSWAFVALCARASRALFPAVVVAGDGRWLFGMRRYLLSSGETDYDFVDFIEGLAHKVSLIGAVLVTLAGVWWMAVLPETMAWFRSSIWVVVALLPLGYFLAMSFIQKKRKLCIFCNYMAFVMTVVMTLVLAALREVLRFVTLMETSGWNALDYKITMDWRLAP